MMDTHELFRTLYGVPRGFRVAWEIKDGCMLRSTYWPTHGEPLIPMEEMAWAAAREIAGKTYGTWVNFYVTDADFSPVPGYRKRMIVNREEP